MALKQRERSPLCKCQECSLADRPYVPSWLLGAKSEWPKLAWIAQAPGHTEVTIGRPLVGSAGKMMWRLMKEAGFNRDKNTLMNICNCWPPTDPQTGQDMKPTPLEQECCSERLKAEIQLIRPKVIVALGDIPLKMLTDCRKSISKARGEIYNLSSRWELPGCKVLACFHPSFVMRQRQWIEIVVKDFKQIYQMLLEDENNEVNTTSNSLTTVHRINLSGLENLPRFNLDPTPQELSEYLSRSNVTTAFDLETAGLNPRKDSILACSFSSGEDAIVIKWANAHLRPIVQRWMEDETAKKVTQNGSFDCSFLDSNSINVQGLDYDTRLAEHLLNSDLPTDLQFLRKQYTDILPYKRARTSKQLSKGDYVTDEECAWDSYTTLKVMQAQLKKITPGNLKVLREIDIPVTFVTNKMTKKGICLDINRLALTYAEMKRIADSLEEKWFAPLSLNPRSPKQLTDYWGIASTSKFNTKMSRVDPEAFIDNIIKKQNHPDWERMQALLDYRSLTKQMSTVMLGMYKRAEETTDGKHFVHTHFHVGKEEYDNKIHGTGTGRLASSNPALQNIQAGYRGIFIADDEDSQLIEADYNQIELIVAAVLGREHGLLDDIANGIKPHHVLGSAIFGRRWDNECQCPPCKAAPGEGCLTVQERLREKATLFGTLGGRGATSIAKEFGVSVSLARDWQAACVERYPGLMRYLQETLETYEKTGKVFTNFGTERTVSEVPQALNNRFQGNAAFVTLTTLIEMDKAGFDLRLTVHDSIMWNCPRNEIKEQADAARKILERPIKELADHCFTCKIKAGDNWGTMEDIEL